MFRTAPERVLNRPYSPLNLSLCYIYPSNGRSRPCSMLHECYMNVTFRFSSSHLWFLVTRCESVEAHFLTFHISFYPPYIYSNTPRILSTSTSHLHTSPRVSTPVSPRNYSRIATRLLPYSLLFIYVFSSIYIRELYHRHTGEIELSSWWHKFIITMKRLYHHDETNFSSWW